MTTEKSAAVTIVTAIPKLVEVLEPLSPDERQRAISAAMIVFGEPLPVPAQAETVQKYRQDESEPAGQGICPKAATWMKKNGITREHLDHVFSIEPDSIDVIASRMPESGKRKQTVQAYIVCGVKSFLRSGDLNFTDADARELCIKVGCYDLANHAINTKGFGNLVTGSKDSGWKLTNPGLSAGAQIIKLLAPDAGT